MTARVVALKPGTMAPAIDRGDKRFRIVKGAPQVILELVQAETSGRAHCGRQKLAQPHTGEGGKMTAANETVVLLVLKYACNLR